MQLDRLVDSLRAESIEARLEPGPATGVLTVAGVAHDSRMVAPGDLFACVVGEHFDGHAFAAGAISAGAAALLVQRPLDAPVPQIVVPDVRMAMGPAAAAVMGQPSDDLTMVGITGTNGKTTVSEMVKRGLEEAGQRCALIGTLTGTRTTPEGPELQKQLRDRIEEGVDAVVMEVSSHALALHRVDGTRFDVAAFTNLGRDHLDFHGTTEAYFRAKARLFEPRLSDRAVINTDDPHGRLLGDTVEIPFLAVGLDAVQDLAHQPWGSTFRWQDTEFRVPLAGSHNASNALVAAAVLTSLGVDASVASAGIAETPAVPGRFERVDHPGPISAVVDYAHTPDALEAVLRAARERTVGDVIVVFGCGGDRDATKRPIMGRVAAELGDLVILTTDNPRSESPAAIIEDVKRGVSSPEAVLVVPDRAEAIAEAVARARPEDLVVIAGKGHETTQIIGERVLDFDDRSEARRAMDARAGEVGGR